MTKQIKITLDAFNAAALAAMLDNGEAGSISLGVDDGSTDGGTQPEQRPAPHPDFAQSPFADVVPESATTTSNNTDSNGGGVSKSYTWATGSCSAHFNSAGGVDSFSYSFVYPAQ